jgi:hypothetical protein
MDGQKLKTIREIDLDYFATEGLYEFCTSYLQYADAMCTHIQGRMTAAHMSVERIVETSLVCGGGVHGLATSQSYKSRALRICQLDWDGTRVSMFSLCLASLPIRWCGEIASTEHSAHWEYYEANLIRAVCITSSCSLFSYQGPCME